MSFAAHALKALVRMQPSVGGIHLLVGKLHALACALAQAHIAMAAAGAQSDRNHEGARERIQ